jgi:hypothetical protein
MRNNPLLFSENSAGLTMWAGLFMFFALFSCGRKMIPEPPDVYTPPGVKGLSATLEAEVAFLSWVVPDGYHQREKGLSEMVVFRAEKIADCPRCPLTYEPIAKLSAWEMTKNDQGDLLGAHRVTVDKKGRSSFYVVAYSKNGVAGPKSDTVEIDRTPEDR